MVVVYRGGITVDVLTAVGNAQRQLHKLHGSIAGLTVLGPEALQRPGPEVRDAGQSISDEFDTIAYASAIVLAESGIQGAFYRSILTGIHMASRRPVPQKVFAEVGEAIEWIAGRNRSSAIATRSTEIHRRIRTLSPAVS